MKEWFKKYFDTSADLRRRSVHVLYLIFLVIILSFIPSSFDKHKVDPQADLLELSEYSVQQANTEIKLFAQIIQDRPDLYQDLKFSALEMERLNSSCTNYLKRLIREVESKGSSVLFKDNNKANINSLEVDSLFSMLLTYRSSINELTEYTAADQLDTLLPLTKYVTDNEGKVIAINEYFEGSNENTINYLKWLTVKVNKAYCIGLNNLSKSIARTFNSLDEVQLSRITSDDKQSSLRDFFKGKRTAPDIPRNTSDNGKNSISIEALHSSDLNVKDLIHFNVKYITSEDEELVVHIKSLDEDLYYNMPKEGSFFYIPQKAGNYTFSFSLGSAKLREQVYVNPPNKLMVQNDLPRLFKGVTNNLKLSEVIVENQWKILAESDNAKCSYQNGKLNIIPNNGGIMKLNIFAIMPYGKILIDKSEYEVIDYPLPSFSVNGLLNGSAFNNQSDLNIILLNDNPGLDQFTIRSYNLTTVNTHSSNNIKTYYLRANTINTAVRSAISAMRSGDKLLFDQIKVSNTRGEIFTLSPYVLNID